MELSENKLFEGPLLGRLIRFLIPLALMNLLQTLYNAADMIVVGLSGVEGAIGSIGTTTAMINLFICFINGFSIGANVVVARCIGAQNRKNTEVAVHTSIIVCAVFGLLTFLVGFFFCPRVLIFLGDTGRVLDMASLYSKIYFAGVPFLSLTNCLMAIFRAKGDTKTPLIVMSSAGLINIILNLIFVLIFHMSVDGVAIATTVSNLLSALVLMMILMHDPGWCRFSFAKLTFSRKAAKEIVKTGLPAAIQNSAFSLSNMLIQSSIIGINNQLCPGGSAVIDGNASSSNLEGFINAADTACHQATVTFISLYFGAGKYSELRKVRRTCVLTTVATGLIFSLVVYFLRKPLLSFYISDPLSVSIAEFRMVYLVLPYFLCAAMDACSGVLRGLGRSLDSTIYSILCCCVFRILWITFVFPAYPTLLTIYLTYPISWILVTVLSFLGSERVIRSLIKNGEAQ